MADLPAAGREIEARYGLASVEGGRHPGWGTANRIVPLGETYLELVAVVDEGDAARNPFGTWVARMSSAGSRLLGWAVRTDDLDTVARRLDLSIATGSRVTRDGRVLRWRLAGIEHASAEPFLPFFIEWAPGTPFPGHTQAPGARIASLELEGDADRLSGWLGADDLPIAVEPGLPTLKSITLSGANGETVLSEL